MTTEEKDKSVHINRLVKEEEELYRRNLLTEDDRERLSGLKVELDQCWDLLNCASGGRCESLETILLKRRCAPPRLREPRAVGLARKQ